MKFVIRNLTQRNLFISYLVLIFVIGPLLAHLLSVFGDEFRHQFSLMELYLSTAGIIALLLIFYIISSKLLFPRVAILPWIEKNVTPREFYWTGILICVISILSLVYYITQNGLGTSWDSYENRYHSNIGIGLITKLFIMFPLGFLIALHCGEKSIRKLKHGSIIFAYGLILTIATGGYRQVLFIGIISFLFILHARGAVSRKELLSISAGSLLLIVFIGAVRNLGMDSTSTISMSNYIYAAIDSLSPFDSFLKIRDYVDSRGAPGASVFINHFLSYIPRFLWEDKPFFILNSGNFFTIFVLNYSRDVTISPTIFGEYYLIGGWYGMILGCIATAFILSLVDALFHPKKSLLGQVFFLFFFYAPFGLAREGLAVYITTLWWVIFIFIACLATVKLLIKASRR